MKKKKLIDSYIEIPNCWDEVSCDEWTRLLVLFEALAHIEMFSFDDLRRKMAEYMLSRKGVGTHVVLRNDRYYLLVDEVAKSLDWMVSKDDQGNVAIRIETTRQLLPSVGKLYGPKSHAEDLTFEEFHLSVAAMNSYIQSQSDNDLLALAAVLYRPLGRDGKRRPFSCDDMQILMDFAADMPWHLKFGIFIWFANLCKFIRSGWFNIKGSEVCFAPLFRRNEAGNELSVGDEVDLGMNGILLSVAQSGVFGDVEKVKKTPLLEVLMKLLSDYQEAERLKSLTNKNK